MIHRTLAALTLLFALCLPFAAEDTKIVKESFESGGKRRPYYLFVPGSLKPETPVPLLVTLHGSGKNGKSLVEKWKDLAVAQGFIVAGPDASNSEAWAISADGPDALRDLVESLKVKYPINDRRVYLFGHSAGANFALLMGLLESEYYAAAAVHAGAIHRDSQAYIDRARRKIPLSIFVGDSDQFFPLAMINETKEALIRRGHQPEVTIIKNHDHNYYDAAAKLNRFVWDFLKGKELAAAPRHEQYDIR
ncbi:MAG TPA: PHB depolymerase family esterase [Blastocatellia bacterium]|nr:PHB depolymerase family esterase [Blastocatellia bacterium]